VSIEDEVKDTFRKIKENIGHPSVLIYNAAARKFKKEGIMEIKTEEFINFWKINTLSYFKLLVKN
jgi:NAD(P)-dependent dehydrogenase (short-subunit alcohol dehydrogenase family)